MKYVHHLVLNYYKKMDKSHGYSHVFDVYNISMMITKKIKKEITKRELMIIKMSALFHDAWDNKYIKDKNETIKIKEELRNDLKKINLNDKDIDDIYIIIDNISFTKEYNLIKKNKKLELFDLTLLRDIVSDADKIASVGEDGIKRIIIYELSINKIEKIEFYIEKIKYLYKNRIEYIINNNYIKTEYGKKIAKERFNEMKEIMNNEKVLYNIIIETIKQNDISESTQAE